MPNIFDYSSPWMASAEGTAGLPSSRVGIAETYPRILASTSAVTVSSQWHATAIYLPVGLKVTGITMFTGPTAGAAMTHQWFGIWDSSLALWAGSADDTNTAWGANTAKRLTLTTAKTTTYAGRYYVGHCVTGTVPSIAAMATGSAAGPLRALTPAATVFDSTTADTALAPTLTQTASSNGANPPFYVVLD